MKFIKNSPHCVKSELDLFYVPPTNSSIESGSWIQYSPIASIEKNSPIEFNITATDNEYIHLNKTLLYLTVHFTNLSTIKNEGENQKFERTDSFAPVNNFASSLFNQIDVSLKGESIETSNKNYAYKAFFSDMLNFGEDAKKTFMQSSLFLKDTSGQMDNLETDISKIHNEGFLSRRELILEGNGSIDMVTRLHSDLFNSDRYLLNGVDLNVKLMRNNPEFYIMKKDNVKLDVRITNAILYVRKARINSDVLLAHSLALEKATAKYPIKRVVVNNYTISKNVLDFTSPSLSAGILPLRIIVGLVDSSAYNGNFLNNPYNFQHFNLREISLFLEGSSVPYNNKGFELDFNNNKYVRGYYSLFEGIDRPVFANGNDILRTDFPRGYAFYAFDISPDLCSSDHFNLLKKGNLNLNLVFSENLKNPVTLLVYMEFDNMIEITNTRQIIKDYQA